MRKYIQIAIHSEIWFMQPEEQHGPRHLPTGTDRPSWSVTHMLHKYPGNLPVNPCTHEGAPNRRALWHPTTLVNPAPSITQSSAAAVTNSLPWLEGSSSSFKQHLAPLRFPKTHPSNIAICLLWWPSWTVFLLFSPVTRERDISFDFLWDILRAYQPPSTSYHHCNQPLPGGNTGTFSGIFDCSHTVWSRANQFPSAKQHD